MRVYVSATFQDLERHRAVINHTLRQLGYVNVAMEDYVAADERPLARCLTDVAECDVYVGILAWRYGYVPDSFPATAGDPPVDTQVGRTSITEFEYRKAVELGKPRLLFLAEDEPAWPESSRDRCTGDNESGARIDAFREAVGNDRLTSTFPHAPAQELGRLLGVALHNWLRKAPPPTLQAATVALDQVRVALDAGEDGLELPSAVLETVLRHRPRTLEEYRLGRIVEWSQPRYALDRRYTRLTLLRDLGEEATQGRWEQTREAFQDLDEGLAKVADTALVVLGAPGCGKSTLLRHFELTEARRGLSDGAERPAITFFVSLSRYRPDTADGPLPDPLEWLGAQWGRQCPNLPPLNEHLGKGRVVLLLDALNEIPENTTEAVVQWKRFVADLDRDGRGNRAVFSCRSLDYSAPLSSNELPVPQLRIEPLADEQVQDFLQRYGPDAEAAGALWKQLEGSAQLELFRNPYYLKLLVQQVGSAGEMPQGRAALFTGFVREALRREVRGDNPLFQAGALLPQRDHLRLLHEGTPWPTPHELPRRGRLIDGLETLAHDMQARQAPGEGSQVRLPYDEAIELTGSKDTELAESILTAGTALGVLEQDIGRDEVLFLHQLLQEYFAGRKLASASEPDITRVALPWRASEVTPSLDAELSRLPASEPLPALSGTGWEQTFLFAAEMSADPDEFVKAVATVNLPLAGRCAAQPSITVANETRHALARALVDRSRDREADLRARIAAGEALGELGDPRFKRRQGPHGAFLLPPLVTIESGAYTIGSDEGIEDDEAPAHAVHLERFAIGRFPVTNAEWRLFMAARGYEDERWWQDEAARAWRRGEGTAEGPRSRLRELRSYFLEDAGRLSELVASGRITTVVAERWESLLAMDEGAFEDELERMYPGGRHTEPSRWGDTLFNGPSLPVVGVCWYEAHAYCAWLSAQTGLVFRLPSESEWEAAARGFEVRRWPWSDEDFDSTRGNTFETHLRRTSPIGVFPTGDTPTGISDLAGNVWEWTTSPYRPYQAELEPGTDDQASATLRVVRGGSWYVDQVGARCAFRGRNGPDDRGYGIGFRVVCSSPIE